MPQWYEMTFEDKTAAYILAFLYSSQHVDVTVNLESLQRDLGRAMREESFLLAKRHAYTSYQWSKANSRYSVVNELLRSAGKEQKKQLGIRLGELKGERMKLHRKLQKLDSELVESRQKKNLRLEEEFRKRAEEAISAFLSGKQRQPQEKALPEDIALVYRLGEFKEGCEAPEWVEESHYDTVAVAVVNKALYVTCNYKTRVVSTFGLTPTLSYRGFGFPGEKLDALYKALNRELQVESEPEILKIVFLKPESVVVEKGVEKSLDEMQAYPHAEMQLASYLQKVGKPERIGVSKECCQRCAAALDKLNVGYTWKKDAYYENWAPPEYIVMGILKEYKVAWK